MGRHSLCEEFTFTDQHEQSMNQGYNALEPSSLARVHSLYPPIDDFPEAIMFPMSLFFPVFRYSKLTIDFINYQNPSDQKATGVPCDTSLIPGLPDSCDVYVEICVSQIGDRYVMTGHH